jgi:ribosomal protein S18 acetylase RimI-like enzyme
VSELQPAGSRRIFDPRILGGPLHLWIGYVGAEPVSVAAAYIGDQAVSIYMVATLPQARGKRYGAALTAQACQAAPDLPAELQASEAGRSVYLRLGFQIVTQYNLWLAPRATLP